MSLLSHRYLLSLDVNKLPTLMRGGAGLEVMGEMIDTMEAGRRDEVDEATAVFSLLASLSCVDRFPMTVAFLSAAQKQRTSSLLSWLHQHAPAATVTVQPSAAVEEAKEQLSHSSDVPSALAVQSVGGSSFVSSSASTSISSHPRFQLPLQLPSSSTSASYPMLVPGWSSFSSPSVSSDATTAQQSTSKGSSSAATVRVPKLSFDSVGVQELRKRFKVCE